MLDVCAELGIVDWRTFYDLPEVVTQAWIERATLNWTNGFATKSGGKQTVQEAARIEAEAIAAMRARSGQGGSP